jgi:hypothetical protein
VRLSREEFVGSGVTVPFTAQGGGAGGTFAKNNTTAREVRHANISRPPLRRGMSSGVLARAMRLWWKAICTSGSGDHFTSNATQSKGDYSWEKGILGY